MSESAISKESAYGKKRNAGNQMYGPGCCAHKLTDAQVARATRHAQFFRQGRSEIGVNVPDHNDKCRC